MKKIILLLLVVFTISSCAYNKVDKSTEIPNKVSNYILNTDSTTLEQVYVYYDNEVGSSKHFYFDKDKNLIQIYSVSKMDISMHGISFILFILLAFLVGWALKSFESKL